MICLRAGLLEAVECLLTPSTPAVPNCCGSKGPAPYWSKPPFLIFDIRALWRSVLSTRAPECQKLKMVKCKALTGSAVKGLKIWQKSVCRLYRNCRKRVWDRCWVFVVNLRSCLLRHDSQHGGGRSAWSVPLSYRLPTSLWPAGLRRSSSRRPVPGRRRLSGVFDHRRGVRRWPLRLRCRPHCRLVPHLSPSTSRRPLRGRL